MARADRSAYPEMRVRSLSLFQKSVMESATAPGSRDRSKDNFLLTVGIAFACAVALVVCIGVAFYRSLANVEETAQWVYHSHETISSLESLLSHMIDIETGQRGFALTGAEQFLDPYHSGLDMVGQDRHAILENLARDKDKHTMPQFLQLEALIDKKIRFVQEIIAMRRGYGLQAVAGNLELLDRSRQAMEEVRAVVKAMQEEEERRLGMRVEESERSIRDTFVLALVGKVVTVFILVWVFVVIRQETIRRRAAQAALERVQVGLESRIQERTAQLSEMNQRLSSLSRQLLKAQEVERRRIARDLHDEIGQALTALKLNLRETDDQSVHPPVKLLIYDSLEILKGVIDGVRNLALDLRPSLLDELGLGPAAKWYLRRQGERAGWATSFALESWPKEPPVEAAITCFRILQEALTNATKHAHATAVEVLLRQQSGCIVLSVRDNGSGFDPDAVRVEARAGRSMGILGMEERANLVGGSLAITSSNHGGTKITVSVPMEVSASLTDQPVMAC